MIDILKRDLESIFEYMGIRDGDILYVENTHPTLDKCVFGYDYLAFTLPFDLMSFFWIAVSSWYCERERLDIQNLPKWLPSDLAADAKLSINGDTCPIISFPSFRLVDW